MTTLINNDSVEFLSLEIEVELFQTLEVLSDGYEKDEIKRMIVISYQPLCLKLATMFYNTTSRNSLEVEDYFQQGILAVYHAIDGFDYRRGNFFPYVCMSIKNAMRTLRNFKGDVVHAPVGKKKDRARVGALTEGHVGGSISPDVLALAREKLEEDRESIREVFRLLRDFDSERSVKIFKMYYSLNGGKSKTLKEVGESFGLTRERVRQLCLDVWNYLEDKGCPIFTESSLVETRERIVLIVSTITSG